MIWILVDSETWRWQPANDKRVIVESAMPSVVGIVRREKPEIVIASPPVGKLKIWFMESGGIAFRDAVDKAKQIFEQRRHLSQDDDALREYIHRFRPDCATPCSGQTDIAALNYVDDSISRI